MEERTDLNPGDGVLVNDPYKGAVHLPDVMLICPIFDEDDVVGYAANSAHHVDIGGPTLGEFRPTALTCTVRELLCRVFVRVDCPPRR